MTDKTVDIDELEKQVDQLEKQVDEVAKAKAKPKDPEDVADGGADDWSEEADKKKATAKAADEVVVIEGQEIAKSTLPEAAFAALKAQAETLKKAQADIAKASEDIAKERDLRLTAEFEKRADEKFKHVPGSVTERGAMLKAIAAMPDEALRKSFEAVFNASEKLASNAFETIGTKGGAETVEKSARDFDAKVADIRKRDNCTRADALEKARVEFPEEFKAYQGAN